MIWRIVDIAYFGRQETPALSETPQILRNNASWLLERGLPKASAACAAGADEIEKLQASVALMKREVLAADALVTVGGKQMVVPSVVKAEIERLRAALKPFADEAAMYEEVHDGVHLFAIDEDGEKSEIDICVGDLRRAAAALKL